MRVAAAVVVTAGPALSSCGAGEERPGPPRLDAVVPGDSFDVPARGG